MTTRRLRVLVAHPSGDLYGSDSMLVETVKGLLDEDMEVQVVLAEPGPLVHRLDDIGASPTIMPTVVLRKSLLRPRAGVSAAGLAAASGRRMLATLRRTRPDVVYLSTLTLPLWLFAARAMGVRTVVHVHEAEAAAAALVRRALHLPLRLADRILANSAYSAATLCRDIPGCAHRLTIVTNGVTVGPPLAPRRREGPLRLGFLGRWSPRKGAHLALEVHRHLARRGLATELLLAGSAFPGYDWYPEGLQRARDDSVTWVGRVSDPSQFWHDIDIALVPSILAEPYGNVAVEALALGRPVVASNCGGLPEAVSGSRAATLVPAGDVNAWADAVAAMAANHPRYIELARADAPTVAARHCPERYRAEVAAAVRRPAKAR